MKHPDESLATPLYVKTSADMPWPAEERVFHVLAGSGLYLCRNNEFFSSSVPANGYPSSLADHRSFCRLRYTKVPRPMVELLVGFFVRTADLHGSEAGALLAWDRPAERYRIIVPPQTATVSQSSWNNSVYPIGLHYDAAPQVPPHMTVVGDVHSHVDEGAYASGTDVRDERHRPGLHVVVGRVRRERPEFHVDVVVDGTRFVVDPPLVLGGFRRPRLNVPKEWIDRVSVEAYRPAKYSSKGGGQSGTKYSSQYDAPRYTPSPTSSTSSS